VAARKKADTIETLLRAYRRQALTLARHKPGHGHPINGRLSSTGRHHMNRSFKLGALAASTILGTTLIAHTAAQAAEVDVMCKYDNVKKYYYCPGGNVGMSSFNSTAFGASALASGSSATAIGADAQAQDQATAVGNHAWANAANATAVGNYASATQWATAIGAGADALSKGVAVGGEAYALPSGTAIGTNAYSQDFGASLGFGAKSNQYGVAIGNAASTLEYGIAIGNKSVAIEQAVALGNFAKATSDYTVAIGAAAKAGSNNATAVGTLATANGASSVSVGDAAYADDDNGIAIGASSKALGSNSLVIGAMAESATGSTGVVVIGAGAKSSGLNSVALGTSAQAHGEYALSLLGNATGDYSIALGKGSSSGSGGLALGLDAFSSGQYSTALGVGAQALADYQLALGGAGSHVRIGDITASTTAQDGASVNLATVDANGVMGRSQVSLNQLLGGLGGGSLFDPTYLETDIAALKTFAADQAMLNMTVSSGLLDHNARIGALEADAGNGGVAYDDSGLIAKIEAQAQYLKNYMDGSFGLLDSKIGDLDSRVVKLENEAPVGGDYDDSALVAKNAQQDTRLDGVEAKNSEQDSRLAGVEAKNVEQDERLGQVETKNGEQDTRLAKVETRNDEQDGKIAKVETVNTVQETKLADHEVRLTKVEDVVNVQKSMNSQMASMQSTLDSHGAAIGTLQGQVGTLFDLAKQNRQGIKAANGGVAMALAMESPAVPSGKSFAISGGVGNFKGQTSLSMALSVAVGEAATVSAGVGYSVNQKDVGTRAGFQIAF
jgi:hypothetical protein